MTNRFSPSRRRLLHVTTAAAGAALVPRLAEAQAATLPDAATAHLPSVLQSLPVSKLAPTLSKTSRPQPPYVLRDFANNPFVTPVGGQLPPGQQRKATAAAVHGPGVDN
jgi:hypothetical protein